MLTIIFLLYIALGLELGAIFWLYDGNSTIKTVMLYLLFWPIMITLRAHRHFNEYRQY